MRVKIWPSVPSGEVMIPPSKSLAHRAILSALLAKGKSHILNIDYSEDILATLNGAALLGAQTERREGELVIEGGHFASSDPLLINAGESGSTLRFFIPIAAARGQEVFFQGSKRLLERPQSVYKDLFEQQGIYFKRENEELHLRGKLSSGKFEVRGDVSSQFITGLMFALPLLKGDSQILISPPFESASYVELTRDVLTAFGIQTEWDKENSLLLLLKGGQSFSPCTYEVEGDYSQLAFFALLGSLRGEVTCKGMKENSSQGDRAILSILHSFGGTADQFTFHQSRLAASQADLSDCPDLGPAVMVLAAFSEGTTIIRGASRLRIKESDRIAAMEEELRRVGVAISSTEDEIQIQGGFSWPEQVVFQGHNDHRIAMSLGILAAAGKSPAVIEGAECVKKSYPGFWEDLASLGVQLEMMEER